MARFKDYTGHEWTLRLTVGVLPDLKRIGCDLSEAVKSGEWLGDIIFGDMERLANILWEFLRDQATVVGLDRESFNKLIDPEFMDAAAAALQDEIIAFFHRGQREAMKAQLPKVTARLNQDMSRIAEKATEQALEAMAAKAESILSGSGGNSVAS